MLGRYLAIGRKTWLILLTPPPLGDDQESFDSGEDRLIERIINLVVLLTEAQKREIA